MFGKEFSINFSKLFWHLQGAAGKVNLNSEERCQEEKDVGSISTLSEVFLPGRGLSKMAFGGWFTKF